MKQFFKFCTVLFLTVFLNSTLSVFAGDYYYCDFSVNGIFYKFIEGKSGEVAVSYEKLGTDIGRYYEDVNYTNYTGSITVPSTVTYNSVTYKVTAVTDHAFYEKSSVTSVTLPNTITSIGSWAFADCTGITWIKLPTSLKSIERGAFDGCIGLTSINLPNGTEIIDDYAFYGCSGLKSITIPNSVTSISLEVFHGCTGLTSITIPSSVKSIGSCAFYGCYNLTSVSIPNSVTSIANSAFAGCSGLTSVKVNWKTPITIDNTVFSNRNNVTLYVPNGCRSAYNSANVWKEFKAIMEEVETTVITNLTNAIYVNATTGLKGNNTTLTINLKNAQTTSAYSFDLVLPKGVTLAKNNSGEYICQLSNRHNGHSASVNYNASTGVYSFAVLSLQSKELKNNDGAILTLQLNVANDMVAGDYPVKIQNAKYSLTSGSTSVTMPETIGVLTIEDYKKGDANGDGTVDIADAVCIVNHVVGKETPAFVVAAADANGDGVVDIADAVRIVNLVVGKIAALSREPNYTLPEPQ